MTVETFGVHSDAVLSDRVHAFGPSVASDKPATAMIARHSKRSFDVIVASLGLAILFPMISLLLLALLIIQGRPFFIRHTRIGWGGRSFPCFKLRSMVTNAEEVLRKHLSEDPRAFAEWQESHKLKNDPRITPLGKFLRKSSVDELPQLLNVIRGEMSLVGPRPIVRDEISRYGCHIEDYKRVRPGLTGLWQISGRSDTSYQERVALDVRYVREWGFWRDLSIIAKTIPALLKTSGSY